MNATDFDKWRERIIGLLRHQMSDNETEERLLKLLETPCVNCDTQQKRDELTGPCIACGGSRIQMEFSRDQLLDCLDDD